MHRLVCDSFEHLLSSSFWLHFCFCYALCFIQTLCLHSPHNTTDINECSSSLAVCDPLSACVNTPGSYVCTPFVWPGSLRLAQGNGVDLGGGNVLLGDTNGGQVFARAAAGDIYCDVSLSVSNLFFFFRFLSANCYDCFLLLWP